VISSGRRTTVEDAIALEEKCQGNKYINIFKTNEEQEICTR